MDITTYRKQHGMDQRDCAEWFGVSLRQIGRWENGESIPKPQMQLKIKQLTKGQVTPADWIDALEQRQQA